MLFTCLHVPVIKLICGGCVLGFHHNLSLLPLNQANVIYIVLYIIFRTWGEIEVLLLSHQLV